jgi:NADPH:quinone reductase-like Zn-dependent oxidoreductase
VLHPVSTILITAAAGRIGTAADALLRGAGEAADRSRPLGQPR